MAKHFNVLDYSVQMCWLLDFYGGLLTLKQQEMLSLYYEEDYSLAEIATEYKVSRQNIHDILKRSEKKLINYEEKLNLVERTLEATQSLNKAKESLINNEFELTKKLIDTVLKRFEGDIHGF